MRVLNPYLFIGLGGSGGKTLQYLRYYLDQRLKRSGWEKGLPDAWQFLWFDVPPEPEQLILMVVYHLFQLIIITFY